MCCLKKQINIRNKNHIPQRKRHYPQQKILDLEQTLNVTLKTESHLTERIREIINVKRKLKRENFLLPL